MPSVIISLLLPNELYRFQPNLFLSSVQDGQILKAVVLRYIKLAWALTLESFFAGIYLVLTRGLFIIYLVSMGLEINSISLIIFSSSLVSMIVSFLIYKYSFFLIKRVRMKSLFFHALERVLWIFIPLIQDYSVVLIVYSIITCLPVSIFINFMIYGLLPEIEIRKVTANRSIAYGISSVLGSFLAVFLIATMPSDLKFLYIFLLGSFIGIISTLVISLLDLSPLEKVKIRSGIEQPERIFSSSVLLLCILFSGNFLGFVWIPYVMTRLSGSDTLAALMNLAATLASVVAAFVWGSRKFKQLRFSLVFDIFIPIMAILTVLPALHVPIFAFSSFMYTGTNFLGSFLFARYKECLGTTKSSALMIGINYLAQLMAALTGMILGGNYVLIFLIIVIVKVISTILVLVIIPETAAITEDAARIYSRILYSNSVIGYYTTVEVSKEALSITLRLLALSLVVLILYVIYRVLMLILL